MSTYVVLAHWTDRGEENDRDSVNRYHKARDLFAAMGVNFLNVWWTQGQYDVIFVLEGPDEITVSAALLKLDSAANIHTETLRGFTEQEMEQIIQEMG
jgi:uncharacterized protein with GYD domain